MKNRNRTTRLRIASERIRQLTNAERAAIVGGVSAGTCDPKTNEPTCTGHTLWVTGPTDDGCRVITLDC